MGLVIKLFFSSSAGPEIRLFEIDRNTSYDELLRRIATRLQVLPSSSTGLGNAASGELGQRQADGGDVSILPWSLVRDGVCVCDMIGDWITVSSEEEWALFVRSCLPCVLDDVQDNITLNVQVHPSSSPVCSQGVSQSANTIRKIGSALKNLFTPSVSTRRIVNKSIESAGNIVQQVDQQQQQQQDSNEEEQEETEELIDDEDDDDLESSVVTSNDIADASESLLPNVSQSLGEISPVSEVHPDPSQADSPTELQEVEGSFEIIDDETTEQQQQPAVEIAVELPVVPPELQGGWDTLVEMGFSDHTKMLALLKKHKSKNLPRIIDLLLQAE